MAERVPCPQVTYLLQTGIERPAPLCLCPVSWRSQLQILSWRSRLSMIPHEWKLLITFIVPMMSLMHMLQTVMCHVALSLNSPSLWIKLVLDVPVECASQL